MGMAVGKAVLDYMDREDVLHLATAVGEYLGQRLESLRAHPSGGDVRGTGLMRGVELVKDKQPKECFASEREIYLKPYRQTRELGLPVLSSNGCDRGRYGDMFTLGPPLTISEREMDHMVDILDEALSRVEKEEGPG